MRDIRVSPVATFRDAKRQFERAYARRLIWEARGNVTRAAILTGLSRNAFRQLLRRNGLRASDYRRTA
jgi:DNA-binding NtrC family response regulator